MAIVLAGLCVVAAASDGGALTGHGGGGAYASADVTEPPRVVVYGDSLAVQSEPYFAAVARALDLTVTVRAFGGIAPCDALEWLRGDVRNAPPQIVVFAFSGNSLSWCMRDTRRRRLQGAGIVSKYRTDIETAIAIATHARVPFVLASAPATEAERSPLGAARPAVPRHRRTTPRDPVRRRRYRRSRRTVNTQPTQQCLPFELNLPQSRTLVQLRRSEVSECGRPTACTSAAIHRVRRRSRRRVRSIRRVRCAMRSRSSPPRKLDLDFLATCRPRSGSHAFVIVGLSRSENAHYCQAVRSLATRVELVSLRRKGTRW